MIPVPPPKHAPGFQQNIVAMPGFYATPTGLVQRKSWDDLHARVEALEAAILKPEQEQTHGQVEHRIAQETPGG